MCECPFFVRIFFNSVDSQVARRILTSRHFFFTPEFYVCVLSSSAEEICTCGVCRDVARRTSFCSACREIQQIFQIYVRVSRQCTLDCVMMLCTSVCFQSEKYHLHIYIECVALETSSPWQLNTIFVLHTVVLACLSKKVFITFVSFFAFVGDTCFSGADALKAWKLMNISGFRIWQETRTNGQARINVCFAVVICEYACLSAMELRRRIGLETCT